MASEDFRLNAGVRYDSNSRLHVPPVEFSWSLHFSPLRRNLSRNTDHAANGSPSVIKGNVLVLKAAPDQELVEYQQERNFYYLTGFDEPDAILLLNATTAPTRRNSLHSRTKACGRTLDGSEAGSWS